MEPALNPRLAKFVEDEVTSGRYATPQDVVNAAVARLMFEREHEPVFAPGELDALLATGEEQHRRGETMTIEELRERLRTPGILPPSQR